MVLLLIACALTLLIETPFLFLSGYKRHQMLLLIVCVNLATNLTMNLCFLFFVPFCVLTVVIAEILVVFIEFSVYSAAWGRNLRLFLLTFIANALSCLLGVFLMPPIANLLGIR